MAQVVELLGDMPKRKQYIVVCSCDLPLTTSSPLDLALSGKYSHEIFNRRGTLRNIHKLRYWGLKEVLTDKYLLDPKEAETLADFLAPMVSAIAPVESDHPLTLLLALAQVRHQRTSTAA